MRDAYYLMCARSLGILALLLVALVSTGCAFPQDPRETLEQVQSGTMRIGIAENEPWARMENGEPSGVEAELLRNFAEELGSEPEFFRGTVPELLEAIKQGELDVVIGGLTRSTPALMQEAGVTNSYLKTHLVVGVPPSEETFDDLSGREVAVEHIGRTAAHLKEKGAIPVQVSDLSTADRPVAAYDWQLEEWGFESTGIRLPEEQHVMAVPRGENGWLVRLEHFLSSQRDEAQRLLREEASG